MSEVEKNETPNAAQKDKGKKKLRLRRFLLFLGPFVVCVAAALVYWTGGRYVDTDNAYVKADMVTISADVSGPVTDVYVEENQYVDKGDPLFKIDSSPYAIALKENEARLQSEIVAIKTLKVDYRQKESELELASIDLRLAEKEYNRQASLDSRQAVVKSQLDKALHDFEVAKQKKRGIRVEMDRILAELDGDQNIPEEQLPQYRLAKAQVEKAALDLRRTTVVAPFSGRVSKIPQVGHHISSGAAVMSLVSDSRFWIEANVKETQLTHVKQDQRAEIEIDTFPGIKWKGKVHSISPATGSEFSVIPAQNATGNWVKVVQRIPVRLSVEEGDAEHRLRVGMSANISIDTEFRRPLVVKITSMIEGTGKAHAALQDEHQ